MSDITFGAIDIRLMPKVDLDPLLLNYWKTFPCPPPWNSGLLFQVNWTNCHVTQEVGVQLRDMMVEKCASYADLEVVAREVGQGYLFQSCSVQCKVIISAVCILLGLFTVIGVFICVRRRRKRKSDFSPTHQTALNASSDRKYYTSCMQGTSPVMKKGKKDSDMDIMLLERETFQNIYTEPGGFAAEQQLVDHEYHDTLNQQLIQIAKMAENRFSDSLKKQKDKSIHDDLNKTTCTDVIRRSSLRDRMSTSISSEIIKTFKRLSRDSSKFKSEPNKNGNRQSRDSSLFFNEVMKESFTEECKPSTSRVSVYEEPTIVTPDDPHASVQCDSVFEIDPSTSVTQLNMDLSVDTLSDDMITFKHSSSDELDSQILMKK